MIAPPLPVPVMAAKAYGLSIRACRQVRGAWRLETDRGVFALKRALPEEKAAFLRAAETHLLDGGFTRFPRQVPTRTGEPECVLATGERFVLRAWLPGIHPKLDLDHPRDIRRLTKAVAEAHLASAGFRPESGPSPEPNPAQFGAHLAEIERLFDRADSGSRFTRLYRQAIPRNLEEGARACQMLREADYEGLLLETRARGGLCHGDLAPANSLIHGPEAFLLDMDRACLAPFPFDLEKLVRRALSLLGWPSRLAMDLLDGYQRHRQLTRREMRVLTALLHWPQAFWRLGHQYFAERLDRPEGFFLSRLWHVENAAQARRSFLAFCRENLW
ncbi:MAG: phosphotransferase [Bacteroidota bacterium]